jgi:NhaC family Na+:H+ antiporter
MVPWSDNGIYMAGILGVATLDYLPYMWLSFACISVTILFGYTDKFMWRVGKAEVSVPESAPEALPKVA